MPRLLPGEREAPELSLPAMIDIVFLLIIFFMTASELTISHAEFLRLPVADQAEEQKQQSGGWVVINVRDDGSLAVRGNAVGPEALRAILRDESALSRDPAGNVNLVVLIRADANTSTGHVQLVMRECVNSGIYKVYIAALKQRATALGVKR